MPFYNELIVTELFLVGFPVIRTFQLFLFFLLLLIYMVTILGNILIITLVWTQTQLKTPMYFFLSNLSFLDIWYISVMLPKMLADLLLTVPRKISVVGCITQCYFFFLLGGLENYFLAVMAYDRYLAICNPLRYSTILNSVCCCQLAIGCWVCSILGGFLPMYWLSNISFCGSNQIDHFFCDVVPLLNSSCTDASKLKIYFFSLLWIVILACIIFTILSYVQIILTVQSICSSSGKTKAFSTCVSHLTVVIIYYGSVIMIYVRSPKGQMFDFDKTVSVFYSVVTPLLNPIIYTLRNKEIRDTFCSIIGRMHRKYT
ncbi:olfactory receptor 6F1-like [Hyperolius riggenbachi]|uniref:olfactory receptor 6F1-like n=1 Tax=Hyperolius riggenbachi TaxID=752182 RepID=UPI0035A2B1A9